MLPAYLLWMESLLTDPKLILKSY